MQNGSWINTTSAYFEWTMDDHFSGIDHVEVRWDDVYWLDKGQLTTITIKNLGEGPHTVYFKAIDNAGNEVLKTIDFTIDLGDPEVWFNEPVPGSRINSTSVSVAWGGADPESGIGTFLIRIDDGDWVDLGPVYETTLVLDEDGQHTIYLKVLDNAGNQIVTSTDVILDREHPQIIDYGPVGENIDPTTAEIFIQFNELLDNNNMDISIDGILGTTTWSFDNVLFFTPEEELKYGTTYEVSVSGKDLSGNPLMPFTWSFSTDDRGYLKGRVLDMSNFPVSDAVITIVDGNTTGTDGAGNFEMTVVSGPRTINIKAPGYMDYTKEIVVIAGETYDLGPVKMEEKVDTGTLSGKVVDDDGDPILGVIVTLDSGETATTPEDGTFEFTVEIGNYTISFVRDGFDRYVETAWVKKDTTEDLGDIELTATDTGKKTDDGGLELWQMQLLIFLFIVILGMVVIFIIMRKSGKSVETIGEE
jgi:hypothetical protein